MLQIQLCCSSHRAWNWSGKNVFGCSGIEILEMFDCFFCVATAVFPCSCRWRCSFLCRTFCWQPHCFNLCLKSQSLIVPVLQRLASQFVCKEGKKKWPLFLDKIQRKQIYVKLLPLDRLNLNFVTLQYWIKCHIFCSVLFKYLEFGGSFVCAKIFIFFWLVCSPYFCLDYKKYY